MKPAMKQRIVAVDLFCGVGGLSHGLIQGGMHVAAGFDIDESCKFPFETNNRAAFVGKDVRALEPSDIESFFVGAPIRLLAGCAPCQPFSTYSQKARKETGSQQSKAHDGKWDLLLEFGRLVRAVQPELVTMENVPQLYTQDVFQRFLASLSGYHLWHKVVDCVRYGVPQTRKRLVLLASKLGPVELIPPTHEKHKSQTVRKAIADLPKIAAGEADPDDPLHMACTLSALNLRRIKASTPGGSWRDWPSPLRSGCHKKISGATYPSVYGRMEWDEPAPTMTTQCFGYGNGRFGHPDQDRAISLREAAILQSFPRDYCFVKQGDPVKFKILGRLIGNAVPVRIGKIVAQSLVQHSLLAASGKFSS